MDPKKRRAMMPLSQEMVESTLSDRSLLALQMRRKLVAKEKAEQKMKKIEQLVISSAEGHQQAAEAAAAIAVDPGRGGPEAIDPQRANLFALGFHH